VCCNAREFQFEVRYSWKRRIERVSDVDAEGFWGNRRICVYQCQQRKHSA